MIYICECLCDYEMNKCIFQNLSVFAKIYQYFYSKIMFAQWLLRFQVAFKIQNFDRDIGFQSETYSLE